MKRKILICGLPGSGKTTLARTLAHMLGAVVFDGDAVRAMDNDTDFSPFGRTRQARRMSWLCDQVVASGGTAIASFVCPTAGTRVEFAADYTIFCDRIVASAYPDTNALWAAPSHADYTVTPEGSAYVHATRILQRLRPIFDPQLPTALLVGRFQPFHEGHQVLFEHALERVGQVCIAIRDTPIDIDNPFPFHFRKQVIEKALDKYHGKFTIIQIPNITRFLYGRDVGYAVEKVDLDKETEKVSATKLRQELYQSIGGIEYDPGC